MESLLENLSPWFTSARFWFLLGAMTVFTIEWVTLLLALAVLRFAAKGGPYEPTTDRHNVPRV